MPCVAQQDNTEIAKVESGISRKDSAAVLIAPVNQVAQGIKFGWIRGVFVRILNDVVSNRLFDIFMISLVRRFDVS